MTHTLIATSYLAPNFFWFYQAIATFLERSLDVNLEISQSQFDPLDDPSLVHDQIDVAFICGLPLIRYCQMNVGQIEAIAAPVIQAERYRNRPIYFSDVIVNATSSITTFEQLADRSFCYNDLGSNSGYNLVRNRLRQGQYSPDFFGRVIQSGSHQRSIQWVVEGKADCAAIDSTVLEQELRHSPQFTQSLRVVESLGPCPIPPIVAATRLGNEFLASLQYALLNPDPILKQHMQQAGIQRFAATHSKDYEAIAHLHEKAIRAGYAVIGRI